MISQQKYLELLETKKTTAALQVLRNELAPMNTEAEQLHTLSRYAISACFYLMKDSTKLVFSCVRILKSYDSGQDGMVHLALQDNSYSTTCSVCPFLLACCPLETQIPLVYIPSSIMIPQRRLAALLLQAREHQYSRCVYHNSPLDSTPSSLYTDHHCNKSDFPNTTTTILQGHSDEVWNMQWSHNGAYLATCGKDKSAIIWKAGVRCVVLRNLLITVLMFNSFQPKLVSQPRTGQRI